MADRQHGHVPRQQLLGVGWTAEQIKSHIRAGELIAVHAGIYAVGHAPATPSRAAAAVLACGEGAALSHSATLGSATI